MLSVEQNDVDPAHASFLRRFFEDNDTGGAYGRQFRGAAAGSDMPMTAE